MKKFSLWLEILHNYTKYLQYITRNNLYRYEQENDPKIIEFLHKLEDQQFKKYEGYDHKHKIKYYNNKHKSHQIYLKIETFEQIQQIEKENSWGYVLHWNWENLVLLFQTLHRVDL